MKQGSRLATAFALALVVSMLATGAARADTLHKAAQGGDLAAVKALIAAGADPNARNKYGFTPLHSAADNSNPAVVEALIAGGADPNARTERGSTPLHMVEGKNANPAVIEAVIEALIAAGADPGARTEEGKTPFDYAKDNEALQGTDVYWRLNEARFE